jgi:predicted nuclease of restriction endonuclease-like (RecB) superfamily
MGTLVSNSKNYRSLVQKLNTTIQTAQVRAAVAVNQELVLLYWSIGKEILVRQEQHGWGAKIIDQLGKDLRKEFPEMGGLSPRNIRYMRTFANCWAKGSIGQQAAAQLPWFHKLRAVG